MRAEMARISYEYLWSTLSLSIIKTGSQDLIKNIIKKVNNRISQQDVFQKFLSGLEYRLKINSKIYCNMVDGKVINFATDNSATLRCYV